MADIQFALQALSEGRFVTRKGMSFKQSKFFVRSSGGKDYLFIRCIRPHSGQEVDSPATLDWDDMTAKTWRLAE